MPFYNATLAGMAAELNSSFKKRKPTIFIPVIQPFSSGGENVCAACSRHDLAAALGLVLWKFVFCGLVTKRNITVCYVLDGFF